MNAAELTKEYLRIVATEWGYLRLEEAEDSNALQLLNIYILPETIKQTSNANRDTKEDLAVPYENNPNGATNNRIINPERNLIPTSLSKALQESKHLVLLGEPGAGKSTALNFIGLYFANQQKKWADNYLLGMEERIPILIKLSDLSKKLSHSNILLRDELVEAVAQRLQNPVDAKQLVEYWVENKNLLVLLDALDETQSHRDNVIRAIRNFATSPIGKQSRIILTSRVTGYGRLSSSDLSDQPSFTEYVLKPFDDNEMEDCLHNWIKALNPEWDDFRVNSRSKEMTEKIRKQPSLRQISKNPLILRLIAEIISKNETFILKNRSQLYEQFINKTWEKAKIRGVAEEQKALVLNGLSALAWHLHHSDEANEDASVTAMQKHAPNAIKDETDARFCLEVARRKMGIITLTNGRLVFNHQTFQEYFVSQRLRKAWMSYQAETWRFLRFRLHLPEWREPLLLLNSSFENKDARIFITKIQKANSLYENLLGRDYVLAAKLLGESNLELNKSDILLRPYVQNLQYWFILFLAIAAFENSFPDYPKRDDRISNIAQYIKWRLTYKASKIMMAIQELGGQSNNILLSGLYSRIRFFKAASLFSITEANKDAQILNLLLDIHDSYINNTDSFEYYFILEALASMGDAKVLPYLISGYKNLKKHPLRKYEARAILEIFEKMSDVISLKLLAKYSNDKDEDLRHSIAIALGNLNDEQALPPLELLLEDEFIYIQKDAYKSICNNASPMVEDIFIKALLSNKCEVKNEIVETLGSIKSQKSAHAIVRAFHDKKIQLEVSMRALALINDKTVSPVIVEHIKKNPIRYDEEGEAEVLLSTLAELGNLTPSNLIDIIINVKPLHNSSAIGWGEFVSPAFEKIIKLFTSHDILEGLMWNISETEEGNGSAVNDRIFRSFCLIGDDAIPLLLNIFKSQKYKPIIIQRRVLHCLGDIGSEKSLDALFDISLGILSSPDNQFYYHANSLLRDLIWSIAKIRHKRPLNEFQQVFETIAAISTEGSYLLWVTDAFAKADNLPSRHLEIADWLKTENNRNLRLAYISALGILGQQEAINTLVEILDNYREVEEKLEILKNEDDLEFLDVVNVIGNTKKIDSRNEQKTIYIKSLEEEICDSIQSGDSIEYLTFLETMLKTNIRELIDSIKGDIKEEIILATYALAQIGHESAYNDLFQFIKEVDSCSFYVEKILHLFVSKQKVNLIFDLSKLLQKEDKKLRYAMIHAFGEIGDIRALPLLLSTKKEDLGFSTLYGWNETETHTSGSVSVSWELSIENIFRKNAYQIPLLEIVEVIKKSNFEYTTTKHILLAFENCDDPSTLLHLKPFVLGIEPYDRYGWKAEAMETFKKLCSKKTIQSKEGVDILVSEYLTVTKRSEVVKAAYEVILGIEDAKLLEYIIEMDKPDVDSTFDWRELNLGLISKIVNIGGIQKINSYKNIILNNIRLSLAVHRILYGKYYLSNRFLLPLIYLFLRDIKPNTDYAENIIIDHSKGIKNENYFEDMFLKKSLELYEKIKTQNFDPLYPPEKSKTIRFINWIGWGSLAVLLLGLLSILGVVLSRTQDILKDQLDFIASQPLPVIIIITIVISVIAVFLGWSVDLIRKKL